MPPRWHEESGQQPWGDYYLRINATPGLKVHEFYIEVEDPVHGLWNVSGSQPGRFNKAMAAARKLLMRRVAWLRRQNNGG